MRISIQRALLLAFTGLIAVLAGTLAWLSYRESTQLAEGLSREVIHAQQQRVENELKIVFQPVTRAVSITLARIRAGDVDLAAPQRQKTILWPWLREVPLVGSLMFGNPAGYQWLLARYSTGVMQSPLLSRQHDLPAIPRSGSLFVTREFDRRRWGDTSHWQIWSADGSQALRRFDVDLPGYEPSEHAWHREALKQLERVDAAGNGVVPESQVAWTDVYTLFTTKSLGISACGAARTPGGEVVITAFDVLLDDLTAFTRARHPTRSAKVFITTDTGEVLGLPDEPQFDSEAVRRSALMRPLEAIGDSALAAFASQWRGRRDAPAAEPVAFVADGERWWGSSAPYGLDADTRLWVGVVVADRDLRALAGFEPMFILWVALIALVFAIPLASVIARSVSRPIGEIIEQGRRIGRLQLEPEPADASALIEVEELRDGLNAMQRALADHIANRDQTRAELEESEERFRLTFELAGLGIMHAGPDGIVTFANQRIATMLGRTRDDLIGSPVMDHTHPDDRERDLERMRRIFEGREQAMQWEKRYIRRDGSVLWGHVVIGLHRDEQGRPLYAVAVIRDVSEHKALEVRVRQSQKLEAVGRLAGGIAHDFNNLLTVITGYASLVAQSLDAQHAAQRDLAEIERAAESAAALTRQLLTYARKDVAAPRVIDAGEVVRDNEQLLKRLVGSQIVFETRVADGEHPVFMDPVQLQQVLVNMVINSRDAMPDGGGLAIEVDRLGDVDDDRDGAERVRVVVRDTGIGMSPDVLARVFEPFFSTKEVSQGSGLGLATCYAIVEQAGGVIEAESTPGVGATFSIVLPCAGQSADARRAVDGARAVRGRGRVLLVEDETQIRDLLERGLKGAGFDVRVARDGEEALRAAKAFEPFDLLITDVIMPNMNGGTLAIALRAHNQDLSVLFISGYSREVLGERLPPDTELMTKPFATQEVVRRAQSIIDTRHRRPGSVMSVARRV